MQTKDQREEVEKNRQDMERTSLYLKNQQLYDETFMDSTCLGRLLVKVLVYHRAGVGSNPTSG